MSTTQKILDLESLVLELDNARHDQKKIVHCHGVFDLLHIGHIKHLEVARALGDLLVVTITPDRFVNKGPHRPAFPEHLRAEALAALEAVDYVAINAWPTAVEIIEKLRPDCFVKGVVPGSGKRDHTDAIAQEKNAVKSVGGELVLTEEQTFSASTLINQFIDVFTPEAEGFLAGFRERVDGQDIVSQIEAARDLNVLVVGESVIDEYVFCSVMDKATKDPVLAARHLHTERYAGGVLAVANHVANFCDNVTLVSMLGEQDPQEEFVRAHLNAAIDAQFLVKSDSPTIVKRRFLQEYKAVKLFEVYEMRSERMSTDDETAFCNKLATCASAVDMVIVVDYGHGLITPRAIKTLVDSEAYLAVNVQANAGNRGYNLISKYPGVAFATIAEHELRLEARDMESDVVKLAKDIAARLQISRMLVTRGEHGCMMFDKDYDAPASVPAFAVQTVDRVGAGDAVLSLSALCSVKKMDAELLAFVANVVGAEACAMLGNKSAIEPSRLFRHITSLLK